MPKELDICYYAAKFNRLSILKWARSPSHLNLLHVISHPLRKGLPKPWDFKVQIWSTKNNNHEIQNYLNTNHFYGKCPRKSCNTVVNLNGRCILEVTGLRSVSYNYLFKEICEVYARKGAPDIIMKRAGLRFINQPKPKEEETDPYGSGSMESQVEKEDMEDRIKRRVKVRVHHRKYHGPAIYHDHYFSRNNPRKYKNREMNRRHYHYSY